MTSNKKYKNLRKISIIASLILVIISPILFYLKSPVWYYPGVLGVWLLFDNLSHLRKNKTTLDLILKGDYKKFVILYLTLLLFGFLIEGIGSLLLKFWSYPKLWSYEPLSKLIFINTIGYLFWPSILMSFRETFNVLYSLLKNKVLSIVASMIIGIFIWEIPNTFSKDWIYKFPYSNMEIFNINIIIVIAWTILIISPLYIYKILNIKS